MPHLIFLSLFFIILCFVNKSLAVAPANSQSQRIQNVNYLQPDIAISRKLYIKALLKSVLDITKPTYGPYKINIKHSGLTPLRKEQEMIKGDNINLIWSTEDANTIDELIQVPFHTMKGALGYRAMIIKKDRQAEFSRVTNLAQLQKLKPGQVEFWTDTFIYRNNGFEVVTASEMSSLFPMLNNDRFDFFPLGASEISQEYALIKQKYHSLAIETDLLIKYSLHMFFMVSPSHTVLAERMQMGLTAIEKSGEFDRLFNEFVQPELNVLNMDNRRVIDLTN